MTQIIPFTLRRLREAKGWTLEQLAERAKIDKQTIWRLEKGEHTNTREHTIKQLAHALGYEPAVLTGKAAPPETDDDRRHFLMSKLNFRINTSAHNALCLVADRYDVTHQEIVELAPFLFCCAAETSLRERRDRLDQARSAWESARNAELQMQHLPVSDSTQTDEKFAAESESIENQDLFGMSLYYDTSFEPGDFNEWTDNPFAIFLGSLANDTGGAATFKAYGFRDSSDYRVCPADAAELVDDSDLAEEILNGHIALNDMPKEIREVLNSKERADWVRAKVEEFRREMRRRIEQSKAREASS